MNSRICKCCQKPFQPKLSIEDWMRGRPYPHVCPDCAASNILRDIERDSNLGAGGDGEIRPAEGESSSADRKPTEESKAVPENRSAAAPIQIHEDKSPGLTMGEVVFEHRENHGRPCWIAIAQIGSIFGAEVDGELRGIGATKEIALERLEEERRKLYESLWA